MRHLFLNLLMALPAVALVGGLLVWFDLIPLGMESQRIVFPIWATATLASWVVTVFMAAGLIKGRGWLVRPLGMLAVTGTVATGISGFFQASVAMFGGLLALTLAASVLALWESRSGSGHHRSFCRGFGIGTWVGVAFTLMSRFPITGTPIIQIMWWDATAWGNGLDWNAASHLGMICLLLTWFFALCVGWLARQYMGCGKVNSGTAGPA